MRTWFGPLSKYPKWERSTYLDYDSVETHCYVGRIVAVGSCSSTYIAEIHSNSGCFGHVGLRHPVQVALVSSSPFWFNLYGTPWAQLGGVHMWLEYIASRLV